jgi:YD repeat-containing protein
LGRKNRRKHKYYYTQNDKDKESFSRNIKHSTEKNCEWWIDFDTMGNVTHKKIVYKLPENIKGKVVEFWIEYNEMGNETHFIRNDGFEYWCMYNKNGNIVHFWDNRGYSEKFTYYKNKFIYKETSLGEKTRYTFEKKDLPITLNYFN